MDKKVLLEIMEFIRQYRDSNRISPTLEEIAEELGVSKITIYGHIKRLERKGAVTQGLCDFNSLFVVS